MDIWGITTAIYSFLVANYFTVFWISVLIAALLVFSEGETRIPLLDTTLATFLVVGGATVFVIGAQGQPLQTISFKIADNIFTAVIVAGFTAIYMKRQ